MCTNRTFKSDSERVESVLGAETSMDSYEKEQEKELRRVFVISSGISISDCHYKGKTNE